MHRSRSAGAPLAALLALIPASALAGLEDPTLPNFPDNSASVEIAKVPGVVDLGDMATVFLCTSVDTAPVHIGVQVFDHTGAVQNNVNAGQGVALSVAPGATVTIATDETAAFLETTRITLPAMTFSQGSARVVASTPRVRCNAVLLDTATSPPAALGTLGQTARLAVGATPSSLALPDFSNSNKATASAVFGGATKRDDLETVVFCTSLASTPVDIGLELIGAGGTVANSVSADNGAVLSVGPGDTVTFGTSGTDAFLETEVVTIPPVAQGMARVVSNSAQVICSAVVVDAAPPLGGPPARSVTELQASGGAIPGAEPEMPTPLPQFSDGSDSIHVALVPGVMKRDQLQTLFFCSSLAATPVNVGVQVFSGDGVLQNDVSSDVGVALDVAPGATVTIATSATASFLETDVIPLNNGLQGSARIVASAPGVSCAVAVVDDLAAPPATMVTLGRPLRPSAGVDPDDEPLPVFGSGRAATHAAWFPGTTKRNAVETDILCTSVATGRIDVGVQVFDKTGAVANDVGAGNGAVLSVAPGQTVTFGTTGTAALLETEVIVLPVIDQGMARVVSTSGDLLCNALVLDDLATPPASMSSLAGFAATCGDGSADFGEQCDGGDDDACPGSCGSDCRCPAACGDGYVQAGEDCDDGNVAGGDCCSSSCTLECDDGNSCTVDLCEPSTGQCTNDATPPAGCFTAARSILQLKPGTTPATNKMKWIWTAGSAVSQADLGDPDTTTTYTLCVGDSVAGAGTIAATMSLPPSPLWISSAPSGWNYTDKAATNDGIAGLQIRTGTAGRSRLKLKAGGANLPMPTPVSPSKFFAKDPEVTVQLRNEETGTCWASTFPTALVNDGLRFRAKAP